MLINKYENENYHIEEVDPIQVIKAKMKYLDLKQKDVVEYFGSKSTTSKILSYKVSLILKHVWILNINLNPPMRLHWTLALEESYWRLRHSLRDCVETKKSLVF